MQKKGIKIEFAITDDIQKAMTDGATMLNKLSDTLRQMGITDKSFADVLKQADKVTATANKASEDANKLLVKIANTLSKAEKSAKELGIDPKMVAFYKDASQLYDVIEARRKDMNAFNWPNAANVGKSF